ncbi:hypothetical protein V8G54_007597 [Vigna mungo]|uniref:Uncharacterized protein n=1 Tax=Vigna mungo TaxID=3915 RepID=A0AAQ3P3M0_VIGMU
MFAFVKRFILIHCNMGSSIVHSCITGFDVSFHGVHEPRDTSEVSARCREKNRHQHRALRQRHRRLPRSRDFRKVPWASGTTLATANPNTKLHGRQTLLFFRLDTGVCLHTSCNADTFFFFFVRFVL